jgi:outer membrane protein assembly factor BamD
MNSRKICLVALLAAFAILLPSCRHKYANKIDKDTQQPDKVLFDIAIKDLERNRFERARLTLQTLMNTYDTSEYMAKSKLAVADSWYRQGGALGFAQAEAEYKDFILFYPNMEEAAEAQVKICKMQYQQMEKADRDPTHALRAEEECRQVISQFPNSKFAPEAMQMMRDTQEVLAEKEMKVGVFYHTKGSFPASANRLQGLVDQFPLYSKGDEALWTMADSYQRMGDRFEPQQAAAYMRIVRDFPLSIHVPEAKARLEAMGRAVPEADAVAEARMKYELENRERRGLMGKIWGPFSGKPDMTPAAKSGTPQMTGFRPMIPYSVPPSAGGNTLGVTDVGVAVAADPSAIDTSPDARANPPADPAAATAAPAAQPAATGAQDNSKKKAAPKKKEAPKKDTKKDAKKDQSAPAKQ